jgi:hypothetical protein
MVNSHSTKGNLTDESSIYTENTHGVSFNDNFTMPFQHIEHGLIHEQEFRSKYQNQNEDQKGYSIHSDKIRTNLPSLESTTIAD